MQSTKRKKKKNEEVIWFFLRYVRWTKRLVILVHLFSFLLFFFPFNLFLPSCSAPFTTPHPSRLPLPYTFTKFLCRLRELLRYTISSSVKGRFFFFFFFWFPPSFLRPMITSRVGGERRAGGCEGWMGRIITNASISQFFPPQCFSPPISTQIHFQGPSKGGPL